MDFLMNSEQIPGTILSRKEMDDCTGLDFLKKVFFVTDGVMLTQIRNISGIDSSTLQNWTKRGWVANSKLKRYNINQVAHILIINMLRACMQLDRIAFLIEYINGDLESDEDDIIKDSELYDDICKILDRIKKDNVGSLDGVRKIILDFTKNYQEPFAGAKERLTKALEVIVTTYYASLLRRHADELLDSME